MIEKDGGALRELLIPFDCFVGGAMGNGKQCWSWIHRDDVVGIILHLINSQESAGIFNATAPIPVSNKQFTQASWPLNVRRQLSLLMSQIFIFPS